MDRKEEDDFVILEKREEYPSSLQQITNNPPTSTHSYISTENIIGTVKVIVDIAKGINEIHATVTGRCTRCGHTSHTRLMCYARWDVYGRLIRD